MPKEMNKKNIFDCSLGVYIPILKVLSLKCVKCFPSINCVFSFLKYWPSCILTVKNHKKPQKPRLRFVFPASGAYFLNGLNTILARILSPSIFWPNQLIKLWAKSAILNFCNFWTFCGLLTGVCEFFSSHIFFLILLTITNKNCSQLSKSDQNWLYYKIIKQKWTKITKKFKIPKIKKSSSTSCLG